MPAPMNQVVPFSSMLGGAARSKDDAPDPDNHLGLATGDSEPEGREMSTWNAGESLQPDLRNVVVHDGRS